MSFTVLKDEDFFSQRFFS